MVDKILTAFTADSFLDASKSQNYFLKAIYPNFMAEDALREKVFTNNANVKFIGFIANL
jgi:hypothetical protein